MDVYTAFQSFTDSFDEVITRIRQLQSSLQFDLAMRPAGSTFSGSVFGKPDLVIKKSFDGAIKGYIMIKITNPIWVDKNIAHVPEVFKGAGEKKVNLYDQDSNIILKDKLLLKVEDLNRQDVVFQRILDILCDYHIFGSENRIEMFSVDPRVASIVAGYITRDDVGAKEAWSEMNDEEKRDVLEFMHELKEKDGNANMAELSFLYDLQSLLFT